MPAAVLKPHRQSNRASDTRRSSRVHVACVRCSRTCELLSHDVAVLLACCPPLSVATLRRGGGGGGGGCAGASTLACAAGDLLTRYLVAILIKIDKLFLLCTRHTRFRDLWLYTTSVAAGTSHGFSH